VGLRLSPLGMSATNWPILPVPDDRWWVWSSQWNDNLQGKPKYSEKTCPSVTLSITNPTWTDLGSNSGSHGGSRRLTAWALTWPFSVYIGINKNVCSTVNDICWLHSASSLHIPSFNGAALLRHVIFVSWSSLIPMSRSSGVFPLFSNSEDADSETSYKAS
jgi:hypothetical protein